MRSGLSFCIQTASHSKLNSPITALGSVPKAHTQGEPEGTWNLEKLHLELKYLGRKLADARLQREGHRVRTGSQLHFLASTQTAFMTVFNPPLQWFWLLLGRQVPGLEWKKQTWTVCSSWDPLQQRCALCRGHWTHRWGTHPGWN